MPAHGGIGARRLEEERHEEVVQLHQRAALWLEENGFAADAAGHRIHAGDFERAAALLEQAWHTGLVPARPAVWLGWLRALPPALVQSRPTLCLTEAWALVGAAQMGAAEARLRDAIRAAVRVRSVQAEAGALRGFAAALRGEARRAIQLSSKALRRLPRAHAAPRAFAHLSLGLARESLGEWEAARDEYFRAGASAEAGRAAGSLWPVCSSSRRCPGIGRGPCGVAPFLAAYRLGSLALARGSLREAARVFEEASQLASWEGDGAPAAGLPETGLGLIFYEWNDLGSAARHLGTAIELGNRSDLRATAIAYAGLAHVRQSQGDPAAARRLIARSEQFVGLGEVGAPALLRIAQAMQARLWLRQGDVDAAARWAESRDASTAAVREDRHAGNAAWARVMLALRRPNDAAGSLQRWLRAARSSPRGSPTPRCQGGCSSPSRP